MYQAGHLGCCDLKHSHQNQLRGMNGLFGLHFQVTVHVGRKSGKEPTHKLEETMDQSCLLAYLQAHALLDFLHILGPLA